jgi:Ca-activated chloride channel family protein
MRARSPRSAVSVSLALLASLPLGAARGAVPVSGPPVSPTKVLRSLATSGPTRGGMMYMPPGRSDAIDPAADRTLSPYLYVAGGDPDTERLPLKETGAHIDVAGVIAHVAVHQVFENGGSSPIEAVYVFPASTRAAVHGMRMKIGARVIEAHIDRRQAAREDYQAAREQGRRASLLEQERPNVFTMGVANVMPGDHIEVSLDYSEMLVPEEGIYELVYPAVVGPRYAGGADPARDTWMANPHLPAGAGVPYKFDVGVHLETGIALRAVSSPSHGIDVSYPSASSADVKLKSREGAGDRDFVLRYRLADDKIETGLLLSPRLPDGDGFFALMMEPPQRPTLAQIPAREFVFLLDVSGSMMGFPLDTAKALMRKLLGQLRPTDEFNLSLFSGTSYVMSPGGSVPATPDNIARAVGLVERQRGGGGTELMGGLEASYRIPRRSPNVSRTVVVITDGYVGVEAQAFRFIRERLDQANLFAFGIGTSVNRALIEGMARAGQGEPFVVLRPEKAAAEADKLRTYIEQPVLTHIAIKFDGFQAAEISPAKVPDLMARRPLVLFGKYHGDPGGRIKVEGLGGGGTPFSHAIEVRKGGETPHNQALRWLWARSWVATLDDERHMGAGKEVEEAMTDLGLRHNLLTPFTSFVAVDQEIANKTGQSKTVRQPLPMPAGVPNTAVAEAGEMQMTAPAHAYRAAPARPAAKHEISDSPLDALSSSVSSGRSRSYAPPAAPLPPAPAPTAAAPREAEASPVMDGDDDEKSEAPRSRHHAARREPASDKRVAVTVVRFQSASASGLGDTSALRAVIEARLAVVGGACPARPGEVVLRLTVDGGGKVVAVDAVSGDKLVAAYLRAQLAGIGSATQATGKTGTFTITVRVSG